MHQLINIIQSIGLGLAAIFVLGLILWVVAQVTISIVEIIDMGWKYATFIFCGIVICGFVCWGIGTIIGNIK